MHTSVTLRTGCCAPGQPEQHRDPVSKKHKQKLNKTNVYKSSNEYLNRRPKTFGDVYRPDDFYCCYLSLVIEN